MRNLVLVVAVLLCLSACGDGGGQPGGVPRVVVTPADPPGLDVSTVATQPVPADLQGIALFHHHVAYVVGEKRLVVMDWRTGASRTVYRSTYGSLFLLRNAGRYRYLVDMRPTPEGDSPDSPRRYVSVDLVTGRARTFQLSTAGQYVGSFNDVAFEVRHGNLLEVQLQPHPDQPDRLLTTSGRVVEAGYDGDHRVVWTQTLRHGDDNPHQVWTMDLFHPGRPPRLLAGTTQHVPSAPVVGDGFAGWADHDDQLALVPTSGGPVVCPPVTLAPATVPSADRHLVAVVDAVGGRTVLTVPRVG